MNRSAAEWLWRAAVLAALCWIGYEVQQMRVDISQPAEDANTAAAEPQADPEDVDDMRAQLAVLDQKMDAMMIAMAQLKK